MRKLNCLVVFAVFLAGLAGGSSASAEKGPFYYLSPVPQAQHASAHTTLIFRPSEVSDTRYAEWTRSVSVTGSHSGFHTGDWIVSNDGKTFVFEPHQPFAAGETVDVVVRNDPGGEKNAAGFSYRFRIRKETTVPQTHAGICDCFAPPPDLDEPERGAKDRPSTSVESLLPDGMKLPRTFPAINVAVSDNPAPGYVFVSNFTIWDFFFPGPPRYMMILRNDGTPVFLRETPGQLVLDFKVQPDGRLSYFVNNGSKYYFMDNTYTVVDSISAQGEGIYTNIHDVQVLPNGNYLLIAWENVPTDMSVIVEGGDPNAVLEATVIQEIQPDHTVVFEWHSIDHFDVLDATHTDLTAARIDYVHPNSIELDHDGNYIMSCRSMDEVTKIDSQTGEIIWRLGGKNNDFTLAGTDEWFSAQHSARRQANGNLTIFDNGSYRPSGYSRAMEFDLDEVNMTATVVWEYGEEDVLSFSMGNAQRLPNGNTIVGNGSTKPNLWEIRPDGSKAYEMSFGGPMFTYRAFRFEWEGVAARPELWARTDDDLLELFFIKFGDDHVAGYNIYRGNAAEPTELAGTTTGNSFLVTEFHAGDELHFRVTALDEGGAESPYSNEITVTPDFGYYTVAANVRVTPRTINLKSNGNYIKARVEFLSECECPVAEANIEATLNDVVGPARVTAVEGDDGYVAGLEISFPRDQVHETLDVGEEVTIKVAGRVDDGRFEAVDHVRVIEPGRGGKSETADGKASPKVAAVHQNLPNPFNPTTVIRYDVPAPGGLVSLRVFDVAGRLVRTLVDENVAPGERSVVWDGRDQHGRALASGVYFYRFEHAGTVQTRKMVLMK